MTAYQVCEMLESRLLMASFGGRVVGYLPDYEANEYSHIDFTGLTQLNYFSITASTGGMLSSSSTSGYSFSQMSSVISEAHADGVPVSITVDPSTPFTTIDASGTATTAFANNLIAFCSNYHLDGIDLDWEPSSATSTQITNYGNLIAALYAQTSQTGLTLSVAVSASQHVIPVSAAADLNWVCVMDYDLECNSSAPYSDSISFMSSWASYGIPTAKLLMGVPFYGRSGTSWSNSQTETYSALMSAYAKANNGSLPPTTADSVTINGVTWGYNGVATMQEKAQYVLANGYGGMAIWELGQDDFTASQSSYNLLAAIKSSMVATPPTWQTAGSGAAFSSFALSNGAAGGLTVGAGTVTLSADAGAALTGFTVVAESGGTVALASTQHLGALTLDGGNVSYAAPAAGVLEVGALGISGASATLDLGDHDMIVHSGNLSLITAEIASGLNLANQGLWNGVGIDSSAAAAANAGRALGVELNSPGGTAVYYSTFDGQSVVATDVLVKYTFFGDANLDGVVDANDYLLIDNGNALRLTGWRNGDFNYDNTINGDDYSLMDNAFQSQGSLADDVSAAVQSIAVNAPANRPSRALASSAPFATQLLAWGPVAVGPSDVDQVVQAAIGLAGDGVGYWIFGS